MGDLLLNQWLVLCVLAGGSWHDIWPTVLLETFLGLRTAKPLQSVQH